MNEDFECIQVFIEGINAKGIESMGYLIEIVAIPETVRMSCISPGLMRALTSAFVMSRRKNSVRVIEASRALPCKV